MYHPVQELFQIQRPQDKHAFSLFYQLVFSVSSLYFLADTEKIILGLFCLLNPLGLHNELTKAIIKIKVSLAILYLKSNFDIDNQWEESPRDTWCTPWVPEWAIVEWIRMATLPSVMLKSIIDYVDPCDQKASEDLRLEPHQFPLDFSSHTKRNSNSQIRLDYPKPVHFFFQRPYQYTNLLSHHWSWNIVGCLSPLRCLIGFSKHSHLDSSHWPNLCL